MSLFERILAARGLIDKASAATFLSPDYSLLHDPFLLPDMEKAVARLVEARKKQEKIKKIFHKFQTQFSLPRCRLILSYDLRDITQKEKYKKRKKLLGRNLNEVLFAF